MGVEYSTNRLDVSTTLATLLDEFSSVTDYRTLRDQLPQRLAGLLQCRCVLLYQRVGETLQLVSGSFADQPGWSATLLAVAHINPVGLDGDELESQAWRARRAIAAALAGTERAQVSAPLIYRQHAIGVLTAIRGPAAHEAPDVAGRSAPDWLPEEMALVALTANVVAMLLENTRLLERDRERIHELSLLNGITSQMNCNVREQARVHSIVVQRTKEIALPDLCAVLTPGVFSYVASDACTDSASSVFGTVSDAPTWLPLHLQRTLLLRWQRDLHAAPLILERDGTQQANEYMEHLDTRIKTFFALPLIGKHGGSLRGGSQFVTGGARGDEANERVLGVLVGAYHKSWQLRREEQVLLQVLTNQASVVLENITLMNDVVEARNETRLLLRQVLDDQRFKELILESISSGLITIDLQGRITTFNRAAESVLGYHPREVMGQSVRKVLDLQCLEKSLQTGQPQHETLLTSGRQGQEIALKVALAPLRDERGRQMGVLATFADITGVYHLEEEKRRLDRLASLGEMSANMAHEVRNPLAAIKTSMQMLRDDLESARASQTTGGVQDEIAVVLKEVERLDGIVRDLLLFARPRQLHLVKDDLGALSARMLHFLRPQFAEHGVRVRLVRQSLPAVRIDIEQMEQVFMNIFLNALQAMPDGGILSVSCQTLYLPGELGQSGGHWLEMVVSDTGVGIAQDALERIFQPFYSTRAHGIGLGLPITRRLLEDHHGTILVESQLGYGTTVSVRLPLNEDDLQVWQKRVEEGNDRYESDDPDR